MWRAEGRPSAQRLRRGPFVPRPGRASAGKFQIEAAFAEELEAQRAGGRDALRPANLDPVAQPVGLAGALADQRMVAFGIDVIVAADGGGGDEAVRAVPVQLDEQAGAGDAGNAAGKGRADLRWRDGWRSAGRRFRARPPWRGARPGRSARRSASSSAISSSARPPAPSFSARIRPRCTIRSA